MKQKNYQETTEHQSLHAIEIDRKKGVFLQNQFTHIPSLQDFMYQVVYGKDTFYTPIRNLKLALFWNQSFPWA